MGDGVGGGVGGASASVTAARLWHQSAVDVEFAAQRARALRLRRERRLRGSQAVDGVSKGAIYPREPSVGGRSTRVMIGI